MKHIHITSDGTRSGTDITVDGRKAPGVHLDGNRGLVMLIRGDDPTELAITLVGPAKRKKRPRRAITSTLLADVARIYRDNLPTGAPTKAVAEHFGIAPSTASLYVKRARNAGVLVLG